MASYTAAYHFDQQPGQDPVLGIVTVDSVEGGHTWLIAELTEGAHEESDGFAEIVDTVDDRALSHFTGSLVAVLAELLTITDLAAGAEVRAIAS